MNVYDGRRYYQLSPKNISNPCEMGVSNMLPHIASRTPECLPAFQAAPSHNTAAAATLVLSLFEDFASPVYKD